LGILTNHKKPSVTGANPGNSREGWHGHRENVGSKVVKKKGERKGWHGTGRNRGATGHWKPGGKNKNSKKNIMQYRGYFARSRFGFYDQGKVQVGGGGVTTAKKRSLKSRKKIRGRRNGTQNAKAERTVAFLKMGEGQRFLKTS